MDLIWKKLKLSKLTVTWEIETLHNNYKSCVANEVQTYMESGKLPASEICLKEKTAFYNALHEKSKIEHDSLLRFYNTRVEH